MKITDLLWDLVTENPLFEMAWQRKEAIKRVRNLQEPVAEHLIKVVLFDSDASHHWESELNAWLRRISTYKLKGGNLLSSDIYYKLLFVEPLGERVNFDDRLEIVLGDPDYSELPRNMSEQEAYEKCESILNQVSHDLASGKLRHVTEYLR